MLRNQGEETKEGAYRDKWHGIVTSWAMAEYVIE
jgi:hypothetical protein